MRISFGALFIVSSIVFAEKHPQNPNNQEIINNIRSISNKCLPGNELSCFSAIQSEISLISTESPAVAKVRYLFAPRALSSFEQASISVETLSLLSSQKLEACQLKYTPLLTLIQEGKVSIKDLASLPDNVFAQWIDQPEKIIEALKMGFSFSNLKDVSLNLIVKLSGNRELTRQFIQEKIDPKRPLKDHFVSELGHGHQFYFSLLSKGNLPLEHLFYADESSFFAKYPDYNTLDLLDFLLEYEIISLQDVLSRDKHDEIYTNIRNTVNLVRSSSTYKLRSLFERYPFNVEKLDFPALQRLSIADLKIDHAMVFGYHPDGKDHCYSTISKTPCHKNYGIAVLDFLDAMIETKNAKAIETIYNAMIEAEGVESSRDMGISIDSQTVPEIREWVEEYVTLQKDRFFQKKEKEQEEEAKQKAKQERAREEEEAKQQRSFRGQESKCTLTDRAILEMGKNAPCEEAKQNYRRLALEKHPDKGGSEEEFIALAAAKDNCEC